MIIVLEGPDGVGKTTLVESLETLHQGSTLVVNHGPPSDVPPAVEYFDSITNAIEQPPDRLVVFDRLHIGELVYGSILRDGPRISALEASMFDMMLEGAGAVLIHCELGSIQTRTRLRARDSFATTDPKSGAGMEHAVQLRAVYRSWIGQEDGRLPGRWMDLNMKGYPDQMASKILTKATIQSSLHKSGWVGPPGADTVLALPSIDCLNIDHLSWLTHQLTLMGEIDTTALVLPGRNKPFVERTTIALGRRSVEWLNMAGWSYSSMVNHKIDEHDYDDSGPGWRSRVASAIEAGRTASRGI